MKKIGYIAVLILCLVFPVKGQDSVTRMLESIEANNTQLKALRELSTAEKLGNKTANNLENPELEVTHNPRAHGDPSGTGIEFTQAFDFPTAYKHRGEVIGMQNKQVDLNYEIQRRQILLEARMLALNNIHQLKLLDIIEVRLTHARELNAAYQSLFERGDINVLERNKTKLNLLQAEKDYQICKVEIGSIHTELERMNGGISLAQLPEAYNTYELPLNFEDWFLGVKYRNPMLQIADHNVDMSKKQEQLARSLNLPKLKAGYVGDLVKNQSRHGVLVSVSIPLWQGRNTVRSQKAQTVAMEYEKLDREVQYRNELRVNYEKAQKLHILLEEYSEVMDNSNNFLLLKKSFDMGQLSLIEYLQELLIYQSAVDEYLNTEKEYFTALAELEQWEK